MPIILRPPQYALRVLPDSDRYKCRFEIASETSDRVYCISFDMATGKRCWCCSCRGCMSTGQCKHLNANNMQGRKFPNWEGSANHQQYLAFLNGEGVASHRPALPSLAEIEKEIGPVKKAKKALPLDEKTAGHVRGILGLKKEPVRKALVCSVADDDILE